MTNTDLEQSAHQLISAKIQAGETVQMAWAVKELIDQQGNITGEGEEFFRFCAREHVYRVVKKVVDKYDQPQVVDQQLTLLGYECLQQAYTVLRTNERQLVPVHLISDEELLQRADEYRRQSEGLLNHAREIELYVANRRKSVAVETAH